MEIESRKDEKIMPSYKYPSYLNLSEVKLSYVSLSILNPSLGLPMEI